MNANDLIRTIHNIVKKQIEPLVSDYVREHPEYFTDCSRSRENKIAQLFISLSYIEPLRDVSHADPTVDVFLGSTERGHGCTEFIAIDPGKLKFNSWYDDHIVSSMEEPLNGENICE